MKKKIEIFLLQKSFINKNAVEFRINALFSLTFTSPNAASGTDGQFSNFQWMDYVWFSTAA